MLTPALVALSLLLIGCGTVQHHPIAVVAAANMALVTSAGVCAVECGVGDVRGTSDGVLIGELALSSFAVVLTAELFIGYATENK